MHIARNGSYGLLPPDDASPRDHDRWYGAAFDGLGGKSDRDTCSTVLDCRDLCATAADGKVSTSKRSFHKDASNSKGLEGLGY